MNASPRSSSHEMKSGDFLAEDGGRLFPDLDRPYRRELLKEVYCRAGPRQASR